MGMMVEHTKKQAYEDVSKLNTPQEAIESITDREQKGKIPKYMADHLRSQVPSDIGSFIEWKHKVLRSLNA